MPMIQIEPGHLITERVTYREPGKKPLIIVQPYFIFVQPVKGNEEYTKRFENLRQGNFVSCVIESSHQGYNGRINCQAYLVNRDGSKIGKVNGNGKSSRDKRQSKVERFVNAEHEFQSRFGNSIPTPEQVEELVKRWNIVLPVF